MHALDLPDPVLELLKEEDVGRLRHAIRFLSRLHRAVIEWRMRGASWSQIAAALTISRGELWTAARARGEGLKARQNLRQVLEIRD